MCDYEGQMNVHKNNIMSESPTLKWLCGSRYSIHCNYNYGSLPAKESPTSFNKHSR